MGEKTAHLKKGSGLGARDLRELGCGTAVGRYTLLRRLAAGGMAEVYLAQAPGISGFEKKVAIKKILPQHARNERFISMLLDEAKITVSLTHPNIAQVLELGLDGEDYFIAMEYVPARPLNKLMQRVDEKDLTHIPIAYSAHIMAEVARGLEHAHTHKDASGQPRGIVHRDISPQNVLIAYTGDVKIIDFGIARAEGRINQTKAGVIKGKLRYLAPEIAMGMEPDHRADIYCCGIVLFEMLTGEAMFAPRSDLEALEMATEARVKSPRARNPKVPKDLDTIVMRALAKDRDNRYQSAKELFSDLRRYLNQHHPDFVESEFEDFIGKMFAEERKEDGELDKRAENLVSQLSSPHNEEEATIAAAHHEILDQVREQVGRRKAYKRLVTRPHISAEGVSEALAVLPSSQLDENSNAHTPVDRNDSSDFRQRQAAARAPTVFASDLPEVSSGQATEEARPPEKVFASWQMYLLAFLFTFGLGGAAMWVGWNSSGGPEADPIPPSQPTRTATEKPQTPPPQPATDRRGELVLRIDPDVPAEIHLDGRVVAIDARSPYVLPNLEPGLHRLSVYAEGYQSAEFSRTLPAGEKLIVSASLKALTGTILLKGNKLGRVSASVGTVEGQRITEIPIPSVVELEIARIGAKPYFTEVSVKGSELLQLKVPNGTKSVRRGTLVVNARPRSTVLVDGRKRGKTPLSVTLRSGKHRVTLVNPNGQKKSFQRVVRPGRKTTFTYRWR